MTQRSLSLLFGDGRQDAPVALRKGEIIPFRQFRDDVRVLAHKLKKAEIRRAALWYEDAYAFAVALFACAHAGSAAIVLPNAQPALLSELAGEWDCLLGNGLTVPSADLPGDDGCIPDLSGNLDMEACRVDFFTSGSTAKPKRVPRTLGQFDREIGIFEKLWGGPRLGATHATVTHQHVYGLAFRLLWPLAAGRPFASHASDVWEGLLPFVAPADVVISSPAHLTRLGGLNGSWKAAMVFSAGAPLPPAAADDAATCFGVAPIEIYGSTETSAIASRVHMSANSAWTPLSGVTVRADENELLCVRSPWVRNEYRTADLITLNPDGSFILRGRADRVVKVEGKRVSLDMVEAALSHLAEVADATAVLLDGPRQELAAILVLTPQGRERLARMGDFRFGRMLRTLLADRLETIARPRRWRFVAELPMAAMGKRSHAAAAALFEDDVHD